MKKCLFLVKMAHILYHYILLLDFNNVQKVPKNRPYKNTQKWPKNDTLLDA